MHETINPVQNIFSKSFIFNHRFHSTFPNNQPSNTFFLQLSTNNGIPFHILLEFILPKYNSTLGHIRIFASHMSVPETTINKDCSIIFSKPNIWMSWYCANILSISIPPFKQFLTKPYFWFCVLTPDFSHILTTRFRGFNISHLSLPFP